MRTIKTLVELSLLVQELEQNGAQVFVRYSRHPHADCKRGHSINHQTGGAEAGLSCEAFHCPEWWPVNGRTVRGWLAMQVRSYSFMRYQGGKSTRGWVLTGQEVGRGSDNEPLVGEARAVAWLSDELVEEAKAFQESA